MSHSVPSLLFRDRAETENVVFSDSNLTIQLYHIHAGISFCHSEQGSEMGATGCQDRAVGLEVSAAHHNDTVPQLTVDTLVVELLEDLLKVTREVHGSERGAGGDPR